MWTTIEGNTGASLSGADIEPPERIDSMTSPMAFSTTLLPAVWPVISMAWRIGTPAVVRAERVRDQRASATFWTMSPILNGIRSRKASHWGRPFSDLRHFWKATKAPIVPTMSRYQEFVMRCEIPTVTFVIAGSSPPNSLKTPANTGTRNAISASSTMMANEMMTDGYIIADLT